jgi:hypothetical protein
MKYELIGTPRRIESDSDEHETVMVIDLRREDGATGDVWIAAGVPDYLRGAAQAAGSQHGLLDVRVFGDAVDMWCPESFQIADEDGGYSGVAADIIAACGDAALTAHRAAMADL